MSSLADTNAEVEAIEAEIAALEEELPAYTGPSGGRGRGTKRGRSASKMEANSRPVRTRKPSSIAAAAVEPSPGFNLLSVKDKKKDLAEKIKQLERQIAKEAAETKMIKEVDSEERKMQMQIEALQKKLEETKQAKEKALKKAQKTAELAKESAPTPVKQTPVKSGRGHKATATPVAPVVPVAAIVQDETTRQYCYCKKLWDQSVPMIGCDACDEWYHLTCLNMFSSEAVCIESYVCVTCQQKKTKNKMRTQYKSDEAMAIEISQMPGELVTREIEVVKAELRELAGKDAEAIIAAIESPPPLEPVQPKEPSVPATATSSSPSSLSNSSSSCSSSSSSTPSSSSSFSSASIPPSSSSSSSHTATSSSVPAPVFVPETPVFPSDGDSVPPPLEAPTATATTETSDTDTIMTTTAATAATAPTTDTITTTTTTTTATPTTVTATSTDGLIEDPSSPLDTVAAESPTTGSPSHTLTNGDSIAESPTASSGSNAETVDEPEVLSEEVM